MSDWLEIVVPVPVAAADEVAALLADRVDAASAGTEIRPGEIVFWVAVEAGEETLALARDAARSLADSGFAIDPSRVRAQPAMPEAEWRDAWKRYFHVTRITRNLVIVPSWESYEPQVGDLILDLDPGQAFGTGAHATTRMMLEELQALADGGARPARFLDVGAGSGILSIAAALLFPDASGVAVDNDPIAVDAARENADHNGVGPRVVSTADAIDTLAPERFELILANIQADVLRMLRPAIVDRLAAGGTLILSGLLATQAEGVADEYAEAGGLERVTVRADCDAPDWCCAVLRAPDRGAR